MSDHKEGYLAKSYHVLFVIYAPIALISIGLNLISDTHVPYLYSMAFLGAGLSVILAVLMWWTFLKHRSIIKYEREAGLPYIIRHQFMLLYLPVAFISMGFCAYYVYEKYVLILDDIEEHAPEVVTILMPTKTSLGQPLEDVTQVNMGIGALLTDNSELTSKYHLEVYNHKNIYSPDVFDYVVAKTQRGSRYFVCTYSDVCTKLITAIKDAKPEIFGVQPIVITTLSSSMQIPLKEGVAYRFYPRSRESAQSLAGYATRIGLKTASFIAADDEYGRNAVKEFANAWQALGGELVEGLFIDSALAVDIANDKVKEFYHGRQLADTIFVAHYQSINTVMNELSQNSKLLVDVNYPYNLLEQLAKQDAKMDNIVVSLPSYKAHAPQLVKTAGVFTYLTLKKLIDVDQKLKEDGSDNFNDYWWRIGDTPFITFERDGDLDYRIEMTASPYNESLLVKAREN